MAVNSQTEGKQQGPRRGFSIILLLIVMVIFVVVVIQQFMLNPEAGSKEITYSELVKLVNTTTQDPACKPGSSELPPPDSGCLRELKFIGLQVSGKFYAGRGARENIQFKSFVPAVESITDIAKRLTEARDEIPISVEQSDDSRALWITIIITAFPLVVIIVLLLIILQLLRALLRRV